MSWLFSQALVEEYLVDTSLDGEPSVPLNGNPTQQAYCAPDKMTAFSRLSRFGMTYKPLTASRGEELLTLYRAGFHAKTSQPQGGGLELTESEAGCGEKWRASFTKYNPDLRSWKTHQCSLLGDLEPFLETWPQWGLMRDGECWEQQTLAQTTRGTESGLLPTPTMQGLNGGSNSRKSAIAKGTWPTPTVCGNYNRKGASATSGDGLATAVLKCATPTARDWRSGKASQATHDKNSRPLSEQIGGSLNPTWVEWLMGWPLGWTDLKPLATDKCHSAQQQPGSFSVNNGEICL
jgi:hypothetical protein